MRFAENLDLAWQFVPQIQTQPVKYIGVAVSCHRRSTCFGYEKCGPEIITTIWLAESNSTFKLAFFRKSQKWSEHAKIDHFICEFEENPNGSQILIQNVEIHGYALYSIGHETLFFLPLCYNNKTQDFTHLFLNSVCIYGNFWVFHWLCVLLLWNLIGGK